MSFNKENEISWDEFSPSTQELFKQLQSEIATERTQRIKADNDLETEINNIKDRINTKLKKFDNILLRIQKIQNKLNSYFDDKGRLVFPNGDKFWIG